MWKIEFLDLWFVYTENASRERERERVNLTWSEKESKKCIKNSAQCKFKIAQLSGPDGSKLKRNTKNDSGAYAPIYIGQLHLNVHG